MSSPFATGTRIVMKDSLADAPRWLSFARPMRIIQTARLSDVLDCLTEVDRALAAGAYIAGCISFEACAALDPAHFVHPPSAFPLVWFAVCEAPEVVELPAPSDYAGFSGGWRPSCSLSDYERALSQIQSHIEHGDVYQVNYTLRLNNRLSTDPWKWFLRLYQAQPASYAAYLDIGAHQICSVSPELFFARKGSRLTCKPMKGTARRGNSADEDLLQAKWLRDSEKNRAENLMIVDMIRNDLGRIADVGSIQVPRLFDIEPYPDVFQMTSTITADTRAPFSETVRALFPCASITGAPKIKALQIIRQLEPLTRQLYTGSIGFLTPEGNGQWNVAIRTAVRETATGQTEYGVGSGIVWGSHAKEEYDECKAKAAVLRNLSVGLQTDGWP